VTEKDGDDLEVYSVPTMTHGRVLVRPARASAARGVLVGFHGYGETATIQMQRLKAVPGSASWTLVSVQALHRFYDRRTGQVIACWMTHEDREDAIADNIVYVATALESVAHDDARPVVFAGFSQGVAMAYRAACRGPQRAAGIISVGGDVPPELSQDPTVVFPPILLVRGVSDEWYSAAKFEEDEAALIARGADVTSVIAECGHEWNAAVDDLAGRFLTRAAIQGRVVSGSES
jgi:predicted esterase